MPVTYNIKYYKRYSSTNGWQYYGFKTPASAIDVDIVEIPSWVIGTNTPGDTDHICDFIKGNIYIDTDSSGGEVYLCTQTLKISLMDQTDNPTQYYEGVDPIQLSPATIAAYFEPIGIHPAVVKTLIGQKVSKSQLFGNTASSNSPKIESSLLPDSVLGQLEYKGTWNPSVQVNKTPNKGEYWIATTADGNYAPNGTLMTASAGTTPPYFVIGDWAVYNGSTWDKVDNTDAVRTVNGRIADVETYRGTITENTTWANFGAKNAGDIWTYKDNTYLNVANIPEFSGVSGGTDNVLNDDVMQSLETEEDVIVCITSGRNAIVDTRSGSVYPVSALSANDGHTVSTNTYIYNTYAAYNAFHVHVGSSEPSHKVDGTIWLADS